jgi:hypothetical protein
MYKQVFIRAVTASWWQHVVAVLGFQSGICLGDFQKHAMPLEIPNVHNASLHTQPKYVSTLKASLEKWVHCVKDHCPY